MQEKITLSGVPETMLQTVYARARESSGRGAIRDPKAEELIGRLDYDFSPAEKDAPMRSGVIARTIVLDRLVHMGREERRGAGGAAAGFPAGGGAQPDGGHGGVRAHIQGVG